MELQPLNSPYEYRGYFIDQFSNLERAIEIYLMNYFLPDSHKDNPKKRELHEILIDRLTFEGKKTALKSLIEKKYKINGFKKTKNNSYPFSKVFNEIREIQEIRNYFAHYHLFITRDAHVVISLLEFRDTTNIIMYTHKQFVNLIKRVQNGIKDLDKIATEIGMKSLSDFISAIIPTLI